MSTAQALLKQAREATDERHADRLAARAIVADPDLGAAYGLRGLLAARRGDPIVAAHYLRVAYARGDRSEGTRAALSACLIAAGEDGVGSRVRAGARLPSALAHFPEGLQAHAGVLRQILSTRLPPAGTAAFLPGEKTPASASGGIPAPARPNDRRSVDVNPPRSRPSGPGVGATRSRPSMPGAVDAPRSRPSMPGAVDAPRSRPSGPAVGAPASRPSGAGGVGVSRSRQSVPDAVPSGSGRVVRRTSIKVPDWLESTHQSATHAGRAGTPDWLQDNTPDVGRSSGFTGGGLELATDPGAPTVSVRSPVTGAIVHQRDLDRQWRDAVMPDLGDRQDPLEARPALIDLVDKPEDLRLAVALPGPVVTSAGGQNPRKLADRVALGIVGDEVLIRDSVHAGTPPARISLRAVTRIEVIDDGRQVSLLLHDKRQMHLDLRDLVRRAPFVASSLVDALAAEIE